MTVKRFSIRKEEVPPGEGSTIDPEVAASMAAAEGTVPPPAEGGGEPPPSDPPPTDPPATDPPPAVDPDFKHNSIWDAHKEKMGDEFTMPENITAENEHQLLSEHVFKQEPVEQPKPEPLGDAFISAIVKEYNDASKGEDFDSSSWIKQRAQVANVKNLEDGDLIKFYLQNKDGVKSEENLRGWEKEELDDHVDNLSIGDKKAKANEIRDSIEKDEADRVEAHKTVVEQEAADNLKSILETNEKEMTTTLAEVKNITDIYSLKPSEAELTEFIPKFKEYFTPDPVTGKAPFWEMLQSNTELFKVAYIMDNAGFILPKLISDNKEAAKEKIVDKLDVNQQTKSPAGTTTNKGVDVGSLAAPDLGQY